jgi:hypothetical protein
MLENAPLCAIAGIFAGAMGNQSLNTFYIAGSYIPGWVNSFACGTRFI